MEKKYLSNAQRLSNARSVTTFLSKLKKKMQEHFLCCAGKSGFNYSFDNGKIKNFQNNFNKIGDLPFSIYYDFETTTLSGFFFFFDAKMYVISYCMIVAFHPSLNLPHMFIYRAYDQTKYELESMVHFSVVQKDFFTFSENFKLKTLKQLKMLFCLSVIE